MPAIFIYGTLKRGFRAHHLIAKEGFIREARTRPRYCLLDLGEYPGLAECEDGQVIQGELWQISSECLRLLDDYEGSEYVRRIVHLEDNPDHIVVFAYLLESPDWSRPRAGPVWIRQT